MSEARYGSHITWGSVCKGGPRGPPPKGLHPLSADRDRSGLMFKFGLVIAVDAVQRKRGKVEMYAVAGEIQGANNIQLSKICTIRTPKGLTI